MLEYQLIFKMYLPDGTYYKKVLSSTDRESAITRFNYVSGLLKDTKKNGRELKEWCMDNDIKGVIIGIEGLYGVAYIKIL
jgi:hypothetical protein